MSRSYNHGGFDDADSPGVFNSPTAAGGGGGGGGALYCSTLTGFTAVGLHLKKCCS